MIRFLPTIPIFLLIAILPLAVSSAEQPHFSKIDCKVCHACEQPTAEDPCLLPCPRFIMPATMEVPDIVIMDELEELYVAVRFNHKLHAEMSDMSEGCEVCHHYEENAQVPSACKHCHPKEIIHENLSQPGLKGAYHRQCLGCHVQWEGDTKCEICHEKKAGGRLHGTATSFAIHTQHQPIKMNELIIFKTEYEENDEVPFHHKFHSTQYERDCNVCHKKQSCEVCHTHREDSHPMGDLSEIDLHETCFQCHEEAECEHCHGRDQTEFFSHESTGWPLKPYHKELYCRNCHADRGAYMKLDQQCEACHKNGWADDFDHKITGIVLDETHVEADCDNCHVDGIGKPSTCMECHDDERKYDPEIGFTPKEE